MFNQTDHVIAEEAKETRRRLWQVIRQIDLAFSNQGTQIVQRIAILICEGIAPVQAGKYDSVDGIRSAKRNKKAARAAATAAEKAHDYMTDQEFVAALAALDAPTPAPLPSQPEQIVAGRFGSPLKTKPTPEDETGQTINPDFYRNMDTALEAKKARARKSA